MEHIIISTRTMPLSCLIAPDSSRYLLVMTSLSLFRVRSLCKPTLHGLAGGILCISRVASLELFSLLALSSLPVPSSSWSMCSNCWLAAVCRANGSVWTLNPRSIYVAGSACGRFFNHCTVGSFSVSGQVLSSFLSL